ncbi:acetyl-CoA synthetase-like protein [Ascodesmis nigricans]|uniref:Acetyl-CoA synthetase-like protein n=1 Tax=Ascodesmis nigricans TaxID=341454 RepID=A0A4S2MPX6_9PEZI|nr:acetyl-CoA synthetase-like protein [Ascodesmis nigricans]
MAWQQDPSKPPSYISRSRWTCEIPHLDLNTWLFGSPTSPLSTSPIYFDARQPTTHNLSLHTYRSLVKRLAKGLKFQGLDDGDRVLLFSGNNVFFPAVYLGIIAAGGIFTGANPAYTARELAFQLKNSGARYCIANEVSIDTAVQAADIIGLPRSSIFVFDDGFLQGHLNGGGPDRWSKTGAEFRAKFGVRHWSELVAEKDDFVWKRFSTPEESNKTAAINYSSGTTGVPKGVELSHYNFIANAVQVITVQNLDPERKTLETRGIGILPMYHAYGQTYYVMLTPVLNWPLYILPKFDFVEFLTCIQKYQITTIGAVPPILTALAKHPVVKKFDLSSIRSIGSGAAPLPKEISREIEESFGKMGKELRVRQGWGMTEATCTILGHHPLDLTPDQGSVGELMPNCLARIVSSSGVDLPANTPGELLISAPNICKGYYENPKATKETFTEDGWLRTGDVAYYTPTGKWHIVDRMKELIKVKGNQVAPAELENVVIEMGGVGDVAVVGVVVNGEERPRAYIVRKSEVTPPVTADEIINHVKEQCTQYKWITGGVVFVDEIPKNPSGKILRKVLRERAAREVATEGKAKL